MHFDKLVGNTDNHIKNLGLLYTADLSECRLSPAYNLLSTLVYREHSNQMSVAIVGGASLG
ncbi:HipA domain-containing protein [Stomatobaculum longum]|uniref:HipA domain-containing protein n=1 Tax=Stomatobaculum longum TaxID=796942 RepID=UPI003FA77B09